MRYLATIALATSFVVAQNIDLGEVVVTATKSEQKLQDVTSNVTVITKEELEDKHISTVAEALAQAQGVIVTQSGGVGQQASVFLRGFDSDSTIVLVDGVKINNPTLIGGQADIGNLILGDIERIEIIKGPQSGIYGANAVAGVINIITKSAIKKCGTINANFEYGKYKSKKSFISIAKKIDNFSAYIGYSYIKTDGFSAQADIDKALSSYEDDGYENKTFNTKVAYDITKSDKIEAQFSKIDSKTDYDQSLTMQDGYQLSQTDKIVSTSYTHKYSDSSYSKIYYNKTNFLKKDPKGWVKEFKGENKEYGVDNKVSFNNIDMLFGINRQISKDIINDITLKATGAYLTGIAKIDNSVITATLRRDNYNKFKNKTTGKIGVKHSFNNGLVVSANYGTAYRVPSVFEYSLNKNLKPETTKGYDLTLSYKNFSATYFYNKIDDEITWDSATFTYINGSKKSTIKGYELSYKNALTNDLFLSLDYTRYIAKDADGKQLLRRPKYIANIGLDYYGFKNTHINLNAQYIGKRDDISFDSATFTSKRVTLKSALVANLSVDYKINDNLTAYLKVNNITDKKYQVVNGYATSGRAFYVGVNAKF